MPERGLDSEQSAARRQKEARALETLRETTIGTVLDLEQLHSFLFVRHGAYRAMSAGEEAARAKERAQGALASTY